MWDKNTEHVYLMDLPLERKLLISKIERYFCIPDNGVCIVFDKNDYKEFNYPAWTTNLGLHMNIRLNSIEDISPKALLDIMYSRNFSNIVWISGRVSRGSDVCFTWMLSHELRHLEHDIISNILSKANYFLYNTLGVIDIDEEKIALSVPTELDAELKAWRVVRQIFGKEDGDSYVLERGKLGADDRLFNSLLKHDPETPYDVIQSTNHILRKYQCQLENLQKENDNPHIMAFNINENCKMLESLVK